MNQSYKSTYDKTSDFKGNVVLRDFNIMEKAEGAGKGICRDFDACVDGSTLEIHLYWMGKGTNSIPEKGVYGPLISAIAVTPSELISYSGLYYFSCH